MEYSTIQLDTKSKDITTIVTEFGEFQHNFLPMVMVISGDISKQNSTNSFVTLN